MRTFPIRVGGPSGPFADEISWEEIARISGAPESQPEFTSVTKRLRRVARFNLEAVKLACAYNRPTGLAVMGLDRIEYANTGVTQALGLTRKALAFLDKLHAATAVPVELAGTGFGTSDVVPFGARIIRPELCHA